MSVVRQQHDHALQHQAYDHERDANLAPFDAHAAMPIKLALKHVPPMIMARAGSEKLDAASPH